MVTGIVVVAFVVAAVAAFFFSRSVKRSMIDMSFDPLKTSEDDGMSPLIGRRTPAERERAKARGASTVDVRQRLDALPQSSAKSAAPTEPEPAYEVADYNAAALAQMAESGSHSHSHSSHFAETPAVDHSSHSSHSSDHGSSYGGDSYGSHHDSGGGGDFGGGGHH